MPISVHVLHQFLNLFFPEPCVFCGKQAIADAMALCVTCGAMVPDRATRRTMDGSIQEWFALGEYAGPIGASIRRAKYRPDLFVMEGIAKRLAFSVEKLDFDVVVPVASAPSRLFRRGFNPALVLAKSLAFQFDKPFRNVLKRVDPVSQSLKTNRQRRCAVNRFEIFRPVPAVSILLVDDVRTTGSTLRECAELLCSAGATRVKAIVAASTSVEKKY